jgi:hypothetical protein
LMNDRVGRGWSTVVFRRLRRAFTPPQRRRAQEVGDDIPVPNEPADRRPLGPPERLRDADYTGD